MTKKGLCHQAMGALHEAFNTYNAVLVMNPSHVLALRAIGLLFQSHGLLTEAAEAFKRALEAEPNDAATKERLAATLTDLGTRVKLMGSPAEAVARYQEASAVDNTYAPAFYNLGVLLSEGGRHDDALACYMTTTRLNPNHAEAHCNIGVLRKLRGDLPGAIAAYEACLRVSPNHHLGRGNLSIALGDSATAVKGEGNTQLAIRMYERALVHDPNNAEAMYNLGVAQAEVGEIDRAVIAYESTLRLRPNCAEAWNNLGVLHREQNNVERAVECYLRAIAINPNFAQPLNNVGVVYTIQGLARAALEVLQRSVAASPTYAVAHNNLGVLLRDTGDIPEALEAYKECARHSPDHRNAEQNYLLGLNYIRPGESAEVCGAHAAWGLRFQTLAGEMLPRRRFVASDMGAGEAVARGLRSEGDPERREGGEGSEGEGNGVVGDEGDGGDGREDSDERRDRRPLEREGGGVDGNRGGGRKLGVVLKEDDDDDDDNEEEEEDEEDDEAAAAAKTTPAAAAAASDCLLVRTYFDTTDAAAAAAASLGERAAGTLPLRIRTRPSRRRLVVGYISPDLYTHSVSYFAFAPLSLHDPARVKTIVYSATPREDGQTQLLRQAVSRVDGTWRECAGLSERQLAEAVRADRVDVLVELTGHTANNRLGTMALRPAPVQVTWIGYPNSTGLTSVDYRITDAVADPPETRQTFTERLVRLPGCFLCYTPSSEAPAVSPAPCLAAGFITFGCFNTLAKVTPAVRKLWGRLLRAVPNSRLLLKAKPFACQTIQHRFLASMAAEGIESWRIDLSPLAGGTGVHLSMYGMVDVALDTFPYAGTTTTCEALYMGVPVVTMLGECHAHNVGASLLTALGLTECITRSEDEYVSTCARLAADPAGVAELRRGLRQRMLSSKLCDGKPFMRRVEDTFAALFRKWCEDNERDDCLLADGVEEDRDAAAAAADGADGGTRPRQQQERRRHEHEHQLQLQQLRLHQHRRWSGRSVASEAEHADAAADDADEARKDNREHAAGRDDTPPRAGAGNASSAAAAANDAASAWSGAAAAGAAFATKQEHGKSGAAAAAVKAAKKKGASVRPSATAVPASKARGGGGDASDKEESYERLDGRSDCSTQEDESDRSKY